MKEENNYYENSSFRGIIYIIISFTILAFVATPDVVRLMLIIGGISFFIAGIRALSHSGPRRHKKCRRPGSCHGTKREKGE